MHECWAEGLQATVSIGAICGLRVPLELWHIVFANMHVCVCVCGVAIWVCVIFVIIFQCGMTKLRIFFKEPFLLSVALGFLFVLQ